MSVLKAIEEAATNEVVLVEDQYIEKHGQANEILSYLAGVSDPDGFRKEIQKALDGGQVFEFFYPEEILIDQLPDYRMTDAKS